MTRELHGGNIYLLAERLGLEEREIVDFSASINPLGVPGSVLEAIKENSKSLSHYPDPDAKRLRLKIAEYTGVSPDSILCGNGSTELIYLIVRALRPSIVLIPAPTFSEYERACRLMGDRLKIVHHNLSDAADFDIKPEEFITAMNSDMKTTLGTRHATLSHNMAFLCNPNNPTGRLIKREDMLKIADAAKRLGCVLIVDEAFIDFCPLDSIVDEVRNNPYLIVLRSMTKFYALSGLRIGYAVLPVSLLKAVKKAKEPWTVNTLAQISGIAAIDDEAYKSETFKLIALEKTEFERGFERLGISCVPSAANYCLLRFNKARELALLLKDKGILVRECSNFTGLDDSYIRVAVKLKSDNRKLLEEVSSWQA